MTIELNIQDVTDAAARAWNEGRLGAQQNNGDCMYAYPEGLEVESLETGDLVMLKPNSCCAVGAYLVENDYTDIVSQSDYNGSSIRSLMHRNVVSFKDEETSEFLGNMQEAHDSNLLPELESLIFNNTKIKNTNEYVSDHS